MTPEPSLGASYRLAIAAMLEVAPIPFAIPFVINDNPSGAAYLAVPLFFASGFGWISLGRWQEALAIFVSRVACLIVIGPFALFFLAFGCAGDGCGGTAAVIAWSPAIVWLAIGFLVPAWSAAMILRGKPLIPDYPPTTNP